MSRRPERPAVAPRGLSRKEAAAYIGVSPTTFDRLIVEGRMPAPTRIYRRVVWDLRLLDRAWDRLAGHAPAGDHEEADPWANA